MTEKPGIRELFELLLEKEASDLHLSVGLPPMVRVHGKLEKIGTENYTDKDIVELLGDIIPADRNDQEPGKEIDLCMDIPGVARFRTNIYQDRNGTCVSLRLIPNKIKTVFELGLPLTIKKACDLPRGLVLVTGPTGSGKSTTLAALIDMINTEKSAHIITIEDPIEFVHEHKKSIVNQREVGMQTGSFASALRAALRQDPNVILVGELRDLETISMAVTAAETGHVVFATLHTKDASQSINRIIDVFPPYQQDQIRIQLAESIEMVISQVLVPGTDGKSRHLAAEILIATMAVKNLIRTKQTHQLKNTMLSGTEFGMQTLEQSLDKLVREGKISKEAAQHYAIEKASGGSAL
jgi:twitching motility protein PilT